jgi:hypothetical protein
MTANPQLIEELLILGCQDELVWFLDDLVHAGTRENGRPQLDRLVAKIGLRACEIT